METLETDLLVIGGGINGVGIATDAVGRGLSVVLCEKDDLANHTSSASSKLIHGGLRYLEQFELRLVREALKEREILIKKAPYLIRPMPFVLPHDSHLRPVWMMRIGLFLYDNLVKRNTLEASKKLDLRSTLKGKPLKDTFTTGFQYTDCQTDDARLVIVNALDAKARGARILTRTRCCSAVRKEGRWEARLQEQPSQREIMVSAKAIVNAAGPWVSRVLQKIIPQSTSNTRLVQGSHFTVPKLYEGHHAYILQNLDQRIVFVIPYEKDFTLIGTTDVPYDKELDTITISDQEIDYLLASVNYYFKTDLTKEAITWSYSGVRSLYDDHAEKPSKITRSYHLDLKDYQGSAPLLSVFGGKLTTYRSLAESALEKLKPYFPQMGGAWTAHSLLPGGDLEGGDLDRFLHQLKSQYPWLPENIRDRYAKNYGTIAHKILYKATRLEDLGRHFGAGCYARDVEYLIHHE